MQKLLIASLMLFGCGKKDDKGAPATTAAEKPTTAMPDKPADKPAEPAAEKPAEKPADKPMDTSHGTCRIVATGAVTADETLPHTGGSMLSVAQWHTPEMRKQMGYPDAGGMILNCQGKTIKLSIMTPMNSTATVPLPMKPASYPIGKKKGSPFMILGSAKLADGKDASIMKSDGTLEITAFDDKRIAGKLTMTAETLPKAATPLELTVEFDLQCYGLSGCPK